MQQGRGTPGAGRRGAAAPGTRHDGGQATRARSSSAVSWGSCPGCRRSAWPARGSSGAATKCSAKSSRPGAAGGSPVRSRSRRTDSSGSGEGRSKTTWRKGARARRAREEGVVLVDGVAGAEVDDALGVLGEDALQGVELEPLPVAVQTLEAVRPGEGRRVVVVVADLLVVVPADGVHRYLRAAPGAGRPPGPGCSCPPRRARSARSRGALGRRGRRGRGRRHVSPSSHSHPRTRRAERTQGIARPSTGGLLRRGWGNGREGPPARRRLPPPRELAKACVGHAGGVGCGGAEWTSSARVIQGEPRRCARSVAPPRVRGSAGWRCGRPVRMWVAPAARRRSPAELAECAPCPSPSASPRRAPLLQSSTGYFARALTRPGRARGGAAQRPRCRAPCAIDLAVAVALSGSVGRLVAFRPRSTRLRARRDAFLDL